MTLRDSDYDTADYLKSPEDIAAYLDAVLEEGDQSMFIVALGNVARARGMTDVARDANVTRDALYKSLREDGDPRLSTFFGLLKALKLDMRLSASEG